MKKYRFYTHLSEDNKVYLEKIVDLTETVINKGEEIREQKLNNYLFLLDEISELLEDARLQITRQKVNEAEEGGCTEQESTKIIMNILREHDELNSYIDELKIKLKKMVNRGLIQNVEFRQKNLRGAKVEDLYFKISNMVNESVADNDFDAMYGMIHGESLLHFIREEFDYRPIYRSFLKEEIMEKLENEGHFVFNIQDSKASYNESIFKNGFILKEDLKEDSQEKVVLVIKENTNANEIHYAMDALVEKQKELYFVCENQKVLFDQGRKIVFSWIVDKNPGFEKQMDLAVNFSTLQRIKGNGIWETTDFRAIHK